MVYKAITLTPNDINNENSVIHLADNCKLLCDNTLALDPMEFVNIANSLDKNIVVISIRSYSIAPLCTFYINHQLHNFITAHDKTPFKPDMVLIHLGQEPNMLKYHRSYDVHSRIKQVRQRFLDDLDCLYTAIDYPKAIITSTPHYYSDKYNIVNMDTFYFFVYNNVEKTDVPDLKTHKLSCLNRVARPTRIHLYSALVQEDFFDDILYSFLAEDLHCTTRGHIHRSIFMPNKYLGYLGTLTAELSNNEQTYINNLLVEHWDRFPIKIDKNEKRLFEVKELMKPTVAYTDTFCNLVSETMFTTADIFLTEKTYRPISLGMPFFVHAASGSIAHLRESGFDVYDDIIDHSYDAEEDYLTRTNMLIASVRTFMLTEHTRDIDREKRNVEHFYSDETYHKFHNTLLTQLKRLV